MLRENIRRFRKAKRLSQEEMAVRLHVVRQTVSKWENGLSVPDADVLVQMAELLDVSVCQLLGVTAEETSDKDLSQELARVNAQLARKNQEEKRLLQANKKRGAILACSFCAMLIALTVKNPVLSLLLTGACVVAAVTILYRNLALLTSVTTEDTRLGVLRAVTFFNVGVFLLAVVVALLTTLGVITFSEDGEKALAMALVSCVILFGGIMSPRLPYTRHTGLRLPWTGQDEDTWHIAHRVLGYISLPVVLLYIACAWTIPSFEAVTLCAMLVWIGVPGGISYLFFYKKYHGGL